VARARGSRCTLPTTGDIGVEAGCARLAREGWPLSPEVDDPMRRPTTLSLAAALPLALALTVLAPLGGCGWDECDGEDPGTIVCEPCTSRDDCTVCREC